ncbi:prepilin-type N-terminal cleavage/methylation domain-containing protein [Alteromonas sp. BL110]|uniref:type IV pilin protein n=1 Tax=Alteromonas sp. BL110 TaxID=1714845 RepID=UPI000E4E64EE|nr:prepilin-type N-terminal cleavage/methylation domain-containing protein [Alteromonas sp. BL110]AXT39751.1 prepilin-type N-terminal cleavage/methylation domain-containing protein [Alteromonas sp. BL110]RKM81762.1 prepilin-type N-terminal cleavage/methylation domain-containing protein [Alteromonas sp. BL110]
MEGNDIANESQIFKDGFTLVEALAVLAIVSILSLATTTAIISSWQLSQVNQVKAYLLSIQSMQSRSWLESGVYLPLTALPQANIAKVSIAQTMSQSGEYEVAATLFFKKQDDSCRVIKISETSLAPKECW